MGLLYFFTKFILRKSIPFFEHLFSNLSINLNKQLKKRLRLYNHSARSRLRWQTVSYQGIGKGEGKADFPPVMRSAHLRPLY